jgi:predicted transcriptional regulator
MSVDSLVEHPVDSVLTQEQRRIYEFLLNRGYSHIREICKQLKIHPTVLDRELKVLEHHQLIDIFPTFKGQRTFIVPSKMSNIRKFMKDNFFILFALKIEQEVQQEKVEKLIDQVFTGSDEQIVTVEFVDKQFNKLFRKFRKTGKV